MPRTTQIATVLSTLLVMATTATSATLTISDLLDGNPILTTSTDLSDARTVLSFEKAVITGTLPASGQIAPGTRSVIFTEPTNDPFGPRQSDFVTFTLGAAAPTFSVTFESDGAANFASDVAALPANTPTVLEDGTFQNVSTLLASGTFAISVQSDLNSPEPEPSSGILLVSGLLLAGLGYIRRKKTSSRPQL